MRRRPEELLKGASPTSRAEHLDLQITRRGAISIESRRAVHPQTIREIGTHQIALNLPQEDTIGPKKRTRQTRGHHRSPHRLTQTIIQRDLATIRRTHQRSQGKIVSLRKIQTQDDGIRKGTKKEGIGSEGAVICHGVRKKYPSLTARREEETTEGIGPE